MARVREDTIHCYEDITYQDLKQPLLIVVDMVNGFIKEGALHDESIMNLVEPIKKMIQHIANPIFIADTHEEDAQEFASYPKHCVAGSSESKIIDELQPFSKNIITKNSTNTFHSKGWQTFMKTSLTNYHDIVICGCCSDICVMQFALSLQTYLNEMNIRGINLYVPIDGVETYHIDGVHDAIECNTYSFANMVGNGIHVVTTISEGK
ncbi:MAG: isochorismatase family cysteine hydrolase [Erysipelotrichaceae bacterium]